MQTSRFSISKYVDNKHIYMHVYVTEVRALKTFCDKCYETFDVSVTEGVLPDQHMG